MANINNDLLLEVLRTIQTGIADLKEGHRMIHLRLSAIERQFTSSQMLVNGNTDDIESLRERVERIERRLELTT